MRLSLPFLLCVFAVALHYNVDADQLSDARYQLGKALLRRAREINETQSNGDELEGNESEMSEEERERVQQLDAAEDIFVGSGNHVYESQGKSETSDSKGEETSGDEDVEGDEAEEDDNNPTSGDGNEGDNDANDDDDEEEKSDDDDDDGTEKKNDTEGTAEEDDSSGSGLIENEDAARRSMDVSGSGSGSESQADDSDQSGSGENTIQELAPASTSPDEASGTEKEPEEEVASKKSEIEETSSGDSEEEEDDNGSAEVIRKGIESLSRLLTPVASGYDFELYSGNTPKDEKEKTNEAEGESEKGYSDDSEEVHVKKCKRVCEDPMSYEQCAVPRCDYKMGTIKDLCIYLCKHQTPVCRQECE